MGVGIDKARRHNQVGGVNNLFRSVRNLTDGGNLAVGHGHIGLIALGPGPIDHGSIFNQQIVRHANPSFC